jgi:hypothetical protein
MGEFLNLKTITKLIFMDLLQSKCHKLYCRRIMSMNQANRKGRAIKNTESPYKEADDFLLSAAATSAVIAGNETVTPSSSADAVAVVIVAVEAAATVAELVRPAKLHVIAVAVAMDAGVVTVSTRLVVDMEATPTDRPVQVRAAVIVVPKFTPATVILAIRPTVTVVKVTVAITPVAPLTVLERTIEGVVSRALNMAG